MQLSSSAACEEDVESATTHACITAMLASDADSRGTVASLAREVEGAANDGIIMMI